MHYSQFDTAAKKVIEQVGKTVVIGVPLGIGKPVGFLNALYRLAEADPTINLTIMTGLTLARPALKSDLEKRFVQPILDRLMKDYEDPLYEIARVQQKLPNNINVIEFFLTPGKYLHNDYVQQHYISSSYVNVVRDALNQSVNVFAQQVAASKEYPGCYSLSSNSDLFPEVRQIFKKLTQQGKKLALIAEVNAHLPFMLGDDAVVKEEEFTHVIDHGRYPSLFAMPHDELELQDQLIGLYASTLIKDNGCLQVGIGKLSNALASALIFRHQNNTLYRQLMTQLSVNEKFGEVIAKSGSLDVFDKGLYASTEMFSDEYTELLNAGILKKRVYDHVGLQRLLNEGVITEILPANIMEILIQHGIIHRELTPADQFFLDHYNIKPGNTLSAGKIVHAGFFLGTRKLYQQLRDLPETLRQQIDMTSIRRTNTIDWNPILAQLQRVNGRFVNSTMMVTMGGAAISDGLKNMREVSGVGGQFEFVEMAQKLEGARSIIYCRSTRRSGRKIVSNIIWDYANLTIPRYLRDIVITEYGIADCRSKTDAEVIQAMLNIADSRFQPELLKFAKESGKLPPDYEIPLAYRRNYIEEFAASLQAVQSKGYCSPYPFGSDLTPEEQVLARALKKLKSASPARRVWLFIKSLFTKVESQNISNYLQRMQLLQTNTLQEWIYKKLLIVLLQTNE